MLVLTRGQQGPDYRNKKDSAAGARWKSRDKKRGKSEERIRTHSERNVVSLNRTQSPPSESYSLP